MDFLDPERRGHGYLSSADLHSFRKMAHASRPPGETVQAAGSGLPNLRSSGPELAVLKLCLLQGLTHLPRPLVVIPLVRTELPEPFEQSGPVDAPLACLLGWSNTLHKPALPATARGKAPPHRYEPAQSPQFVRGTRRWLRFDPASFEPSARCLPSSVTLWRFPSIFNSTRKRHGCDTPGPSLTPENTTLSEPGI
jgi:hypothetical protein